MQRQIVFIHGGNTYGSYEEYIRDLKRTKLDFARLTKVRWRDTFARELGDGFQVIRPEMPNPNNARYKEWEIWFRKIVPFLEDGVILIGHSMGGIFLAKYLATHRLRVKVAATILIAAPFHDKGMNESLGDFALPYSLRRFGCRGGRILIYHSADDPVVPVAHAGGYKRALPDATVRMFIDKGHFNQSTFPELAKEIQRIVRGGE